MLKRHVVVGQRVEPVKLSRAREMRRSMTETEEILWHRLRRKQLHGLGFRRQQVIDGFIVDFYCASAGVIIEIDGDVHLHQQEYDEERDRWLRARELKILRLKNEEIEGDLETILERIASFCGALV